MQWSFLGANFSAAVQESCSRSHVHSMTHNQYLSVCKQAVYSSAPWKAHVFYLWSLQQCHKYFPCYSCNVSPTWRVVWRLSVHCSILFPSLNRMDFVIWTLPSSLHMSRATLTSHLETQRLSRWRSSKMGQWLSVLTLRTDLLFSTAMVSTMNLPVVSSLYTYVYQNTLKGNTVTQNLVFQVIPLMPWTTLCLQWDMAP